jgi:hypothetical protein
MLFHLGGVNSGERYVPLPDSAAVSALNALELEVILDAIQASMPNGGTIFNTFVFKHTNKKTERGRECRFLYKDAGTRNDC